MLFALGVEPVGVSNSCDHPPVVADIPMVTSTVIDQETRSAAEIDDQMQSVEGQSMSLILSSWLGYNQI